MKGPPESTTSSSEGEVSNDSVTTPVRPAEFQQVVMHAQNQTILIEVLNESKDQVGLVLCFVCIQLSIRTCTYVYVHMHVCVCIGKYGSTSYIGMTWGKNGGQ